MATRYKDRITILEDAEIEELYGRPRFTHDERVRLDEVTRKALDRLYLERDGGYGVTPLKQDPKDFSRSEMRREMARCRSLEPLYRTAMALLPELGISNDSIAYYAALVDYYTVQKLQQLKQGMARLYLLCFLLQRYQRTNDNLINALIYQVRKVLSAAKVCLQERLLSDRMEGSKNVQHIGQILDLFLDDSIADSVSFGEIKRRAFSILERDKIKRAADFIGAHSIDVTALEWEFVANLAPMFKPHLRPLLRHLPLAGQRQDADLLEAIDFLKACFEEGRSLIRCRFEQIPKAFIPQSAKPYLYEKDADGHRRIHPDKYEFQLLSTVRMVSISLSRENGFGKHAVKPASSTPSESASVKEADMATTGTLAAGAVPRARISRSNTNPSIPGIAMSDNTTFGWLFFIASRPSKPSLAATTFAPKRCNKTRKNLRASSWSSTTTTVRLVKRGGRHVRSKFAWIRFFGPVLAPKQILVLESANPGLCRESSILTCWGEKTFSRRAFSQVSSDPVGVVVASCHKQNRRHREAA